MSIFKTLRQMIAGYFRPRREQPDPIPEPATVPAFLRPKETIFEPPSIQLMSSAFTRELVRIANEQVGVREVGGNNKGPRVVEYQKATWLRPAAWPWCAAFTAWCLREALKNPDARHSIWLKGNGGSWRCKDASAYGWEKWARQKKLQLLPETARAMAGDFVTFDFSHIGIVVEDQLRAGAGHIVTVEGNTDGSGSREGGGVYRKERNWKLIRNLIRIPAR